MSPWIRTSVVDRQFLDLLEGALSRGVQVDIAYGLDDENRPSGSDQGALDSLHRLGQKYQLLRIHHLGDTHAKILVCDHKYVVVTSFNWLSFKGDPVMPFRDERGVMVLIADKVDEVYDSYLSRMED